MKNLILVIYLTTIFLGTNNGFTSEKGNGGGAYICPNPKESELLDLFEAQLEPPYNQVAKKIAQSNEPVEIQINRALKRVVLLLPQYKTQLLAVAAQIRKPNVKGGSYAIPTNSKLPFPTDTNHALEKDGCTPRGIGLYDDEKDFLSYDAKLLAGLSNTDQAAFWVHETVYKVLRGIKSNLPNEKVVPVAQDSRAARQFVGYAFSNLSIAILEAQPRSEVYACSTRWPDFSDGLSSIYVSVIDESLLAYQTVQYDRSQGLDLFVSGVDFLKLGPTHHSKKLAYSTEPVLGVFLEYMMLRTDLPSFANDRLRSAIGPSDRDMLLIGFLKCSPVDVSDLDAEEPL